VHPDTIRTCDLCLRRPNWHYAASFGMGLSQPIARIECCVSPQPTENLQSKNLCSIWSVNSGITPATSGTNGNAAPCEAETLDFSMLCGVISGFGTQGRGLRSVLATALEFLVQTIARIRCGGPPASRRVRSSPTSPVGIGSKIKKWRDQPVCPPSAPGKLLTGFQNKVPPAACRQRLKVGDVHAGPPEYACRPR
jgi:hypothetical protein